MKNLYVPYEIAVKLKEKGFTDYTPIRVWDKNGEKLVNDLTPKFKKETKVFAPLYDQVFDWLRNVHGYQLFSDYTFYDGFYYGYKWVNSHGDYGVIWKDGEGINPDGWDTPEEARNEAIIEILKLIP